MKKVSEVLGGLTEDGETQLVKLRAKPRPEDEEAVSALTAQVAELEALAGAELQASQTTLLVTKTVPRSVCARVLLGTLGRALTADAEAAGSARALELVRDAREAAAAHGVALRGPTSHSSQRTAG